MNIYNYDLIITTSNIKGQILEKASKNKVLLKAKILTVSEVEKAILGDVQDSEILKMSRNFNIPYNIAKIYAKNLVYKNEELKKYYDSVVITYPNHQLVSSSSNILLINVNLEPLIIDFFSTKTVDYYTTDEAYSHEIIKFIDIYDEVSFVASKICELSDSIDLSKMKLVNAGDDYTFALSDIFKKYNIPLNLKNSSSILKTYTFNNFYNTLKETKDISLSLDTIEKDEIYTKIITFLNNTDTEVIDNNFLEYLKDSFSKTSTIGKVYKNAVNLINLEDIYDDESYYFILGFNDRSIPVVHKDEDFYEDSTKGKLGIFTSLEKNKNSLDLFLNIYKGYKNLFITYKEKSNFSTFHKSTIISDYNLPVIEGEKNFNYSNKFNEYYLAKELDNFSKFNIVSNELLLLKHNYDIELGSYSNNFSGIDSSLFMDTMKNLNLSYTSVGNYYKCGFKYYVNSILKIDSFEESLPTFIGNLFHLVLSKMYDDNFDLGNIYNAYINEHEINSMWKFYAKKLKSELVYVVNFFKNFNTSSFLNEAIKEEKVIFKEILPNVTFTGIIDSVKYNSEKGIAIIIDYKTGSINSSLDNINHGFNLQLPVYIKLAEKLLPEFVIGGIYLQKILNNSSVDPNENDKDKALKLEGYTVSDTKLLEVIDITYEKSEFIKSLELTDKGYSRFSKVLSEEDLEKVGNIAFDKVLEAANSIKSAKFDINPKIINEKNKSCEFCSYKDLCYVKYEDRVILEDTKLATILKGSDESA